jgi:hypothetical protein
VTPSFVERWATLEQGTPEAGAALGGSAASSRPKGGGLGLRDGVAAECCRGRARVTCDWDFIESNKVEALAVTA